MNTPPGPPDPVSLTGHLPQATPGERVEAWFEFMEAHDRFTRQWFAERIEPEQDLNEVLREYYRRRSDEHESMLIAMAKQLSIREAEWARRDTEHVE